MDLGIGATVKNVQIDGLVVMKIIKHCEEDNTGPELVQGVLLGLVVGETLEVTNCFPFPRVPEDSEFDEVQYQMDMMRCLRHVNIDHLHVGWYQSSFHGNFINRPFLESQFSYQNAIEESVVLIYDPLKTGQGNLSLKAFRLTPKMMKLYEAGEFTVESLKAQKLGFTDVYEEVPIKIKNSPLTGLMLFKVKDEDPVPEKVNYLNLAHNTSLERQLKLTMQAVDELTQESVKFVQYQRAVGKQQYNKNTHIQRRNAENIQRKKNDQDPLPEEDLSKLFKPVAQPPRIDATLAAGQVKAFCGNVNTFTTQSLGRIFMAQAFDSAEKS
ncbi:eukaryotic translation initiation factor 3 subunit H-like [Styela clava]